MSDQRAFRGVWIPADIWMNRDLSLQEKVMLIEIDSLQHPERGCFKTNSRLAEFFGLSASRVSRIISKLENDGWLRVEYIREDKQIVERRIFMARRLADVEGVAETQEGYCGNASNPSANQQEGYCGNASERGSGFRGSELGVQGENSSSSSAELNNAFDRFWTAGMVKQGKAKSQAKFSQLCKTMSLTADQLADKLVADIKARLSAGQFGFDRLHPLTYLNGQRWEDDIVSGSNVHQFPGKPRPQHHNLDQASDTGLTRRADGTFSL